MWPSFLCRFTILFSTAKFKLGHNFSQFIHRFNIWILRCCPWAVYTSKFFPIPKRSGRLGFLESLGCTSKFLMIKLPVLQKKCSCSIIMQVTILCQFKAWKYCFQTWMRVWIVKLFCGCAACLQTLAIYSIKGLHLPVAKAQLYLDSSHM